MGNACCPKSKKNKHIEIINVGDDEQHSKTEKLIINNSALQTEINGQISNESSIVADSSYVLADSVRNRRVRLMTLKGSKRKTN